MKAHWSKRTLTFKKPAGTSRGVMDTRNIWIITLSQNDIIGIGECAPLPGLSLDFMDPTLILPYDRGENRKDLKKQLFSPCANANRGNTRGSKNRDEPVMNIYESKLDKVCENPQYYLDDLSQLTDYPSIRCGLEMAYLDLTNGGGQNYFDDFKSIQINGLIWMGDPDFMLHQVEQKLIEGWKCIKMKIGALDFEKELEILYSIRSRFNKDELELRVDANGAFSESDVYNKLDKLSKFDLHSIEQPIKSGQWELLSKLCQKSPVPIALDEELIPLIDDEDRIEMLDKVKPQYVVLKPSLIGGFSESEKWVELAKERNIGWWITSALESNIGLNAIAQWTGTMNPDGFQGLGTGQLFLNNIPSPLKVESGFLSKDNSPIWDDVNQFISNWYSQKDEMVLQTSGSTGKPKSISVKKEWMKNSAHLTGKTFGLKGGETALICMPMKYVAGKMMVIRALEIGLDLKVVEPSSSPLKGIDGQIDFVAMVPFQLENSLNDLDKVKTLIVGGGQVNPKLVEKLQNVNTIDDPTSILPYSRGEEENVDEQQVNSPCNRGNTRGSERMKTCTIIFETYGMTETLTHVAIRSLNGPNKSDAFQALDGVHFEKDSRDCLVIHAPRLNPNPVITNDIIELESDNSFRLLGRFDNVINSGGIKIIPEVVEAKLADKIPNRRYFIAGIPDNSLGEKVVLVVEGDEMDISFLKLDKYEEPKEIYFIPQFVETESGKIKRDEIVKLID